ncbi:MAG: hypothetical protein ACTHKT_13255, partial [Solirubrobacterales bacterium]
MACLLPTSARAAPCSDEAFRTGPSASLPDCRAYELVSPPGSNGRLLEPISGFSFEAAWELFPTELASPSRDSIVYATFESPLLSPSGPNGNIDLYEALRGPSGWTTARRLTPSGDQGVNPNVGGVSSDHSYSFFHVAPIGGLGPPRIGGSLAGEFGAAYLSKPDGTVEAVAIGAEGEEPLAQGRYISEGGKHVIFSTGKQDVQSIWCQSAIVGGHECKALKLEPNAPETGTGAVYDREAGGTAHVVSLLPPNITPTAGQQALYQGASKDGTSIAFKIEGNLYLRVNSGGETGEEETEEAAPAA